MCKQDYFSKKERSHMHNPKIYFMSCKNGGGSCRAWGRDQGVCVWEREGGGSQVPSLTT